MTHFALVEAGGTKFLLGVADPTGRITATTRIATTAPAATLAAALRWFGDSGANFAATGIAAFGPLDLDPASPTWGHIGRTSKAHWSGTDLVGPFTRGLGCPTGIETDVNGAALAEACRGAGAGLNSLLYLTVGTGIGGGYVSGGHLLRGLSHPEMGHIRVPRHRDDGNFAGLCPFHGDCLEGLASGPAIAARWGARLSDLPADHPGHGIIGWYLAQACITIQAVLEPARIVIGGGVSATPGLLDRIRTDAARLAGGYFAGRMADVIVAPALGDRSGLFGALAIAQAALAQAALAQAAFTQTPVNSTS